MNFKAAERKTKRSRLNCYGFNTVRPVDSKHFSACIKLKPVRKFIFIKSSFFFRKERKFNLRHNRIPAVLHRKNHRASGKINRRSRAECAAVCRNSIIRHCLRIIKANPGRNSFYQSNLKRNGSVYYKTGRKCLNRKIFFKRKTNIKRSRTVRFLPYKLT